MQVCSQCVRNPRTFKKSSYDIMLCFVLFTFFILVFCSQLLTVSSHGFLTFSDISCRAVAIFLTKFCFITSTTDFTGTCACIWNYLIDYQKLIFVVRFIIIFAGKKYHDDNNENYNKKVTTKFISSLRSSS